MIPTRNACTFDPAVQKRRKNQFTSDEPELTAIFGVD